MMAPNVKFKATQDWTSCTSSYQSNGNQEVKIRLRKINEKTGKDFTEWAYAPYLSVYESDNGPLVRICRLPPFYIHVELPILGLGASSC